MFRYLRAFSSARTVLKKPVAPVYKLYPSLKLCSKVETHYDALGVSPDATLSEIKAAYYKLTLEYHPDRNPSEEAKRIFQKVSDAYEVLSNYEARKNYDTHIMVPKHQVPDILSKTDRKGRRVAVKRAYDPHDPVSQASREIYSYVLKEKLQYGGVSMEAPLTQSEAEIVEKATDNADTFLLVCSFIALYIIVFGYRDLLGKQKKLTDKLHGPGFMEKRLAAMQAE